MSDFSANWYPGHMAKSIKNFQQIEKFVDFWFEIVDARAPLSSRGENLLEFLNKKPFIIVLNKSDLADDSITNSWISYFKKNNIISIMCNNKIKIKDTVLNSIKKMNLNKKTKIIKSAVIGVPNVGKSCFINNLKGSKKLKVENRAGVTRNLQWVSCGPLEICDTPGILPPRMDSNNAKKISYLGLIKSEVIDMEDVAINLIVDTKMSNDSHAFLSNFAKSHGCLLSGGKLDLNRAANLFVKKFQEGKFGKVSLEVPD